MSTEISSSDDQIDVSSLDDRIEELEGERDALQDDIDDYELVISEVDTADENEEAVSREDREGYTEAQNEIGGARDRRKAWDESDDAEELKKLKELKDDIDDADGPLIRESYFETYARDLAEDIGAISKDSAWPATCIDWEKAASELQVDYTSVEFDGVTYYYRG